jgi:hypothetical protein
MPRRSSHTITALTAVMLAGGLILAPDASASAGHIAPPLALFGLPSLHSIIKAIASGFFGALAGALVPSWLTHGTVATIQHLVALPDPAGWRNVGRLQGEMTYLGAMLLPVTLAVGAVRYWLIGLTGAAHPASAVVRCAGACGVLVAYRWIVEQTVAATNTLTHGILGLPVVASGLQRIIGVLFGGALLSGAGGVFGAFLVIIGVVFAAGLFAAQVLLTVVLAVLIVAGPPLIALSAIPELSHLARGWADALLAVALIPLGWTVLFATAGALCLDATSFTGASGGLPGHVAAAFAGLITFVLAVKLPLMMLGELRHVFARQSVRGGAGSSQPSPMAGGERVRVAHARLRAVGLEGVPSLGRSVGRAAGAMGAPEGGPVGAARRGLGAAARRAGMAGASGGPPAAGSGGTGGGPQRARGPADRRRGVRARLADARGILAGAPGEAMTAVRSSSRRAANPRATRVQRPGTAAAAARSSTRSSSAAPAREGPRVGPGQPGAGARVAAATPGAAPAGAGAPPLARATRRAPRVPAAAQPVGAPSRSEPERKQGDARSTPPTPPRRQQPRPIGSPSGPPAHDTAAAVRTAGTGPRARRAKEDPTRPPSAVRAPRTGDQGAARRTPPKRTPKGRPGSGT